jgi:hypothetical protein
MSAAANDDVALDAIVDRLECSMDRIEAAALNDNDDPLRPAAAITRHLGSLAAGNATCRPHPNSTIAS